MKQLKTVQVSVVEWGKKNRRKRTSAQEDRVSRRRGERKHKQLQKANERSFGSITIKFNCYCWLGQNMRWRSYLIHSFILARLCFQAENLVICILMRREGEAIKSESDGGEFLPRALRVLIIV